MADELPAQVVRDLGTSAGDLAIVGAIIGLAEALGLQLVADGVETPAAALTLIKHRCYRVHGFLPSRPVPANAMQSLLSVRWMPVYFLADLVASYAVTRCPVRWMCGLGETSACGRIVSAVRLR